MRPGMGASPTRDVSEAEMKACGQTRRLTSCRTTMSPDIARETLLKRSVFIHNGNVTGAHQGRSGTMEIDPILTLL